MYRGCYRSIDLGPGKQIQQLQLGMETDFKDIKNKKKEEFWPIQFSFLVAISMEIYILSYLSEKAWALTIQTTYKFGLV